MWVINPAGLQVEIQDDRWEADNLEAQGFKKCELQCSPHTLPPDQKRNRTYYMSIIVMAWNRLDMTKKCIDSLIQYTTLDYELVLVDNGSTDGTPDYFRELASKMDNVTLVLNETNRGVAGGRNDGIMASKGRFLAFFDNDSTVGENWDRICMETFDANPRAGFVGKLGTNFHAFDQNGMRLITPIDHPIQVDVVSGGATVIRREVFHEVGLLDEWGMGEFWHEDSELCLRAGFAGWYSYTVNFPWEHEWHGTYKKEKGKAWFDKFQSNLDYIKNKCKAENVIRVYRDYHGEDCMESLCICTTNLCNELRKKGWIVIRKPTKKIVPIGLRICTGNVIEYMGKSYWWVHQENDVMQDGWLEPLEEADFINPPSKFCAENLVRSGVPAEKMVDLIPNGLDGNIYNPDINPTVQFAETFLLFANGATQPRKGTNVLLEAYFEEFSGDDNIVLYLKDGNYGHKNETQKLISNLRNGKSNPPRVIYEYNYWPFEKLAKYYRRAAMNGAFVNPHRSEGFGLCILEALCCGAPVICTGYGGNMEFCTEENCDLLSYKMIPSIFHNNPEEPYYSPGQKPMWAEPKKADLKNKLRAAYYNPAFKDRSKKDIAKRDQEARKLLETWRWEAVAERFNAYFSNLKHNAGR